MMKNAIILVSEGSLQLAQKIAALLPDSAVYSQKELEGCIVIKSYALFMRKNFSQLERIVFIGAMGICVRSIAACVKDKYKDPAVVCVDSTGKFVIPVLSGHIGGANELARKIAQAIDGEAVITTQSDCMELWALDTLAERFNWRISAGRKEMNSIIALFVGLKPTALLLDVRDKGTGYLESTLPNHVKVFYSFADIDFKEFELLIAVTPYIYDAPVPALCFRPSVLHLGIGCRKECDPSGVAGFISESLAEHKLSALSIATIGTIELKKDEPLLKSLAAEWPWAALKIWTAQELAGIDVPNPSEKAFEATGVYGVSEGAALKSSGSIGLVIEKQKCKLTEGNDFTYAAALDPQLMRSGFIEIVGAGPVIRNSYPFAASACWSRQTWCFTQAVWFPRNSHITPSREQP